MTFIIHMNKYVKKIYTITCVYIEKNCMNVIDGNFILFLGVNNKSLKKINGKVDTFNMAAN